MCCRSLFTSIFLRILCLYSRSLLFVVLWVFLFDHFFGYEDNTGFLKYKLCPLLLFIYHVELMLICLSVFGRLLSETILDWLFFFWVFLNYRVNCNFSGEQLIFLIQMVKSMCGVFCVPFLCFSPWSTAAPCVPPLCCQSVWVFVSYMDIFLREDIVVPAIIIFILY